VTFKKTVLLLILLIPIVSIAGMALYFQGYLGTTQMQLFHAVQADNSKRVSVLIEKTNNLNFRDDCDNTLLCTACYKAGHDVIELLLSNGADANYRQGKDSAEGDTPLHCAVWADNIDAVKLLLKYGADANATKWKNQTPMHLLNPLRTKNRLGIVKLLLEHGANPNIQDDNGWSPLHKILIQESSSIEIVKLMVKYGADPYLENKITPLHYPDSNPFEFRDYTIGRTPFEIAEKKQLTEILQTFEGN